jgi:hypothetical protein
MQDLIAKEAVLDAIKLNLPNSSDLDFLESRHENNRCLF